VEIEFFLAADLKNLALCQTEKIVF